MLNNISNKTLSNKKSLRASLSKQQPSDTIATAIVGMAGVFPQADDIHALWSNLAQKKIGIQAVPSNRWNVDQHYSADKSQILNGKAYNKWGGFLQHAGDFDASFFSISPREAQMLDPQERLSLQQAYLALEDSGYYKQLASSAEKPRVGVFAGTTNSSYKALATELQHNGQMAFTASNHASLAGRISHALDLKGPSLTLDTACSSSVYALHYACLSLENNDCDFAIVCCANIYSHHSKYVEMCGGMLLADDQQHQSFHLDGKGFIPGESVAAIVIKKVTTASADDNVYANILASVVNHSGNTQTFLQHSEAQMQAIMQSGLDKASLSADAIDYIEMQGLGQYGIDKSEYDAVIACYSENIKIGTLKPNIGHSEASSGLSQVIKAALQINYQQLLPSVVDNERCFANQQIVKESLMMEKNQQSPMRIGINSFGAFGSGGHILLEQCVSAHRQQSASEASMQAPYIFLLSAQTVALLKDYCQRLHDFMIQRPALNVADVSYTLSQVRQHYACRYVIVAENIDAFSNKITELISYLHDVKEQQKSRLSTSEYPLDLACSKHAQSQDIEEWMNSDNKSAIASDINAKLLHLPLPNFKTKYYWLEREVSLKATVSKITTADPSEVQSIRKSDNNTFVSLISSFIGQESETLARDKPLNELGLDSIMTMDLFRQLNDSYYNIQLEDLIKTDMSIDGISYYLDTLEKKDSKLSAYAFPSNEEQSIDILSAYLRGIDLNHAKSVIYDDITDDENSQFKTIETYIDKHNALWIVLNNEPANVISALMLDEICRVYDFLRDIENSDSIKVIYLTHRGSHFSIGGDRLDFVNSINDGPDAMISEFRRKIFELIQKKHHALHIGVCTGNAQGGGFELLLQTDLQFVQPDIQMGLPEIKSGIFPGMGGVSYLREQIGYARANRLVMTGDTISSDNAYQMGLISHLSNTAFEDAFMLHKVIPDLNAALAVKALNVEQEQQLLSKDIPAWETYLLQHIASFSEHIKEDFTYLELVKTSK